jgi:hypothetical protein
MFLSNGGTIFTVRYDVNLVCARAHNYIYYSVRSVNMTTLNN